MALFEGASLSTAAIPLTPAREAPHRSDRYDFCSPFRMLLLMCVFLVIAGQNSWFTEAVPQGQQLGHIKEGYYQSPLYLQLLTLSVYVMTFGLLLGRIKYIFHAMVRQKLFACFICLALMSVLWSQSPLDTGRRLPLLISLIALGWYIGLYYTAEEQIRMTLTIGLIILLSSTALALLAPRYGLDTGGEWKGVMGTKNQFGHAILFLFSGLLFRTKRSHRSFWTLVGVFALIALVMARSAESLLLLALLATIRYSGPLFQRSRKDKLPFLTYLAVMGFILLIVGRITVLALLRKDATLTGRTDEWAVILPHAMKHFLLGYGYQGFWTGTGDSLDVMRRVGGWMHGADSGYLDIFLQFGIVGLGLALLIMLGAARRALKLLKSDRQPLLVYWYLALICISLIGNVADGYFPITGGAPEVMLIFSCVSLWKLSSGDVAKLNESQRMIE